MSHSDKTKRALEVAINQIQYLKKRNELLEAQISIVDTFRAVAFGIRPNQGYSTSEDGEYLLTLELRGLEEEIKVT